MVLMYFNIALIDAVLTYQIRKFERKEKDKSIKL